MRRQDQSATLKPSMPAGEQAVNEGHLEPFSFKARSAKAGRAFRILAQVLGLEPRTVPVCINLRSRHS